MKQKSQSLNIGPILVNGFCNQARSKFFSENNPLTISRNQIAMKNEYCCHWCHAL